MTSRKNAIYPHSEYYKQPRINVDENVDEIVVFIGVSIDHSKWTERGKRVAFFYVHHGMDKCPDLCDMMEHSIPGCTSANLSGPAGRVFGQRAVAGMHILPDLIYKSRKPTTYISSRDIFATVYQLAITVAHRGIDAQYGFVDEPIGPLCNPCTGSQLVDGFEYYAPIDKVHYEKICEELRAFDRVAATLHLGELNETHSESWIYSPYSEAVALSINTYNIHTSWPETALDDYMHVLEYRFLVRKVIRHAVSIMEPSRSSSPLLPNVPNSTPQLGTVSPPHHTPMTQSL